jgi:hypothetical protein
MFWVDPTDPEVIAAVVGDLPEGEIPEEDMAAVVQAIAVAGEILTLATGYGVHPAGEITEEFLGRASIRLSMLYGPVTSVIRVVEVATDDTEREVSFRHIGQTVYLSPQQGVGGSLPLWRTNWAGGGRQTFHRVTYQFASTITPGARQALLAYAREFFLLAIGSDECGLPQRVTSIDREGLGIQLLTPADVLDKGRTGIQAVDDWLAKANPKQTARPSQVFTPDAPPGIGTRLRRLG